MKRTPSTIAVDLTPVLPGGENGGAKIFVLELLKRLADRAPQTRFVLLTQAGSHEELSHMDRTNMQRMMVVGLVVTKSLKPRITRLASRLLPHLPGRVRRAALSLGYRVNSALKRGRSSGLLRQIGADLLFCPFTAPTYFEPGIPTVCTIYDLQYKTYPEFFSPEDVAHRDRTFHDACRRGTMLTAISEYSRQSALKYGDLEPARIRTIHLRMAQRIAPTTSASLEVLQHLELTPRKYLIYPANFWRHKNHEMLLTAFAMARLGGLDASIRLVCTGAAGVRQTWLKSAARAMALDGSVIFPGYLSNEHLAVLISNAGGVVFPSLYEGFGLPVIEAMAAGVPVACSNTTSLPEVAADAAILFDPRVPSQIAQALLALTQDTELRNHLVSVGRVRAEEFDDSMRMAQEYWDLFLSALASESDQDTLTGTYPDGWSGPHLEIQVSKKHRPCEIQLEVMAPDWLPHSRIKLRASAQGAVRAQSFNVRRGVTSVCTFTLNGSGSHVEIDIVPTFVPARLGHGDDQRELSLMLRRCSIVDPRGVRLELFPEESRA